MRLSVPLTFSVTVAFKGNLHWSLSPIVGNPGHIARFPTVYPRLNDRAADFDWERHAIWRVFRVRFARSVKQICSGLDINGVAMNRGTLFIAIVDG